MPLTAEELKIGTYIPPPSKPSSLPGWVIPLVLAGGAALVGAVFFLRKKKTTVVANRRRKTCR